MENETEKKSNNVIKKSLKAIITLLLIFVIVGLVCFFVYFNWILKTPLGGNDKKIFVVEKDQPTLQIAENLKLNNLIRSDWAFYLEAKMKNQTLIPGIYELSPSASIKDDLDIISNGKTKIVKITIPEGYRNEQIGQVLAKNKIVDYSTFVKAAKPYEGKLFPDTYFFSPDDSAAKIISEMSTDYETRTAGLNLTKEDLIIASIVEHEADNEAERPIIAGVYKNRLNAGMKMQSDPTVEFAKDNIAIANLPASEQQNFKFWQPITNADYQTADDPYNTYLTDGLPPGPICNPGLLSIEATINSTPSNYLYFIVENGQVYGAKTYQEHEQNIKKYMN